MNILNPIGRVDMTRQQMLEPLMETISPRRILSFGCSWGDELTWLQNLYPKARVVGVEINANRRRAALKLDFTVHRKININWREFDLITACNVFCHTDQEHTEELKESAHKELENIHKVLKQDGDLILISTPVMPDPNLFEPLVKYTAAEYQPEAHRRGRQLAANDYIWFKKI